MASFGGLVGIYAIALVAVGLASRRFQLPLGERKCFDDWCFVVNGVHRGGDDFVLDAATINSGRRTQAPDTPETSAVFDGAFVPVGCLGIADRIEGGTEKKLTVSFHAPGNVRKVDFCVTEGGGLSVLIIGDENSPFHAKTVWQVLP